MRRAQTAVTVRVPALVPIASRMGTYATALSPAEVRTRSRRRHKSAGICELLGEQQPTVHQRARTHHAPR